MSFVASSQDVDCGDLGFRLVEPSLYPFVEVTQSKLVSVDSNVDESMVGSHELTFEAYFLKEEAITEDFSTWWLDGLTLTLTFLDGVKDPPVAIDVIEAMYEVKVGEVE